MIRGHRRKGFQDPPKSIVDNAPIDYPKQTTEEVEIVFNSALQQSPNRSPSPTVDNNNNNSLKRCASHDPKNALQPAKIRLKVSPTRDLSPDSSLNASPIESSPSSSSSSSSSVSLIDQSEPSISPNAENQTISDQNMQPSNSCETTKPGRRIKMTPTRDQSTSLHQNGTESPKNRSYQPAVRRLNLHSDVPSPVLLSYLQSNQCRLVGAIDLCDRSHLYALLHSYYFCFCLFFTYKIRSIIASTQRRHQTSAIAQLLAEQQTNSARKNKNVCAFYCGFGLKLIVFLYTHSK